MANSTFEKKKKIFKGASTTYYYSSIFFPPQIKEDIFTLYAYVRKADDLIDTIPPKLREFKKFRLDTRKAHEGKKVQDVIISEFMKLSKEREFDFAWTEAFLDAMETDLKKKKYNTYKELQSYMYGSAEVIGLYLSRIFGIPDKALEYAKAQGEAMQFINFIRDIDEDHKLGRQYIPTEDLKKFKTSIPPKPGEEENFKKLVRYEIARYKKIQKKSEKGYPYIAHRQLIMVRTSAGMYNWTARQIEKDPMIVFEHKVKPPKWYVIWTALKNSLTTWTGRSLTS